MPSRGPIETMGTITCTSYERGLTSAVAGRTTSSRDFVERFAKLNEIDRLQEGLARDLAA
jgi:hypothetical protein